MQRSLNTKHCSWPTRRMAGRRTAAMRSQRRQCRGHPHSPPCCSLCDRCRAHSPIPSQPAKLGKLRRRPAAQANLLRCQAIDEQPQDPGRPHGSQRGPGALPVAHWRPPAHRGAPAGCSRRRCEQARRKRSLEGAQKGPAAACHCRRRCRLPARRLPPARHCCQLDRVDL